MRKSWPMPIEMPNLLELQLQLRRVVLGGDTTELVGAIRGDGLNPAARLRIYRNHALTTLGAVLEGTFPVVCRLVDKRFFAYAAHEYLREHPPHSRCLIDYGADFADFLAAFEPCRDLPYLADVARFANGPSRWQRRCGRQLRCRLRHSPRCHPKELPASAKVRSTAVGELFRLGLADRCDLAGEPAERGPDGGSSRAALPLSRSAETGDSVAWRRFPRPRHLRFPNGTRRTVSALAAAAATRRYRTPPSISPQRSIAPSPKGSPSPSSAGRVQPTGVTRPGSDRQTHLDRANFCSTKIG